MKIRKEVMVEIEIIAQNYCGSECSWNNKYSCSFYKEIRAFHESIECYLRCPQCVEEFGTEGKEWCDV